MDAQKLIDAVSNVNGGSFVGIDTFTDVPLTGGKSNPHQGRVTKRMVDAQVMVFQNKNINAYDAMIKRRLEAEGKDPANFVLSPRAWGHRIPNMPLVEHKGQYYLEVIFLRPGTTTLMLDGVPCKAGDIIGFPTPREGQQGGLEDKVIIRTFAADSITHIRVNGVEVG